MIRTPAEQVLVGTMHLAKGLEFKAVGVIACDDGILPLQSRLEGVADETELDDVDETERHLFYVACTRARDRLLITAVRPASEYIQDLRTTLRPSRGLARESESDERMPRHAERSGNDADKRCSA